ncbi:sacsin N-terminal ATP-binding-like domain-containing protein [Thauera phenylacetica]|nr:hypothetical protein [Thauera phenylacetica]
MTDLVVPVAAKHSARDDIETKTRGEVEAYLSARGKTHIYDGARNLSQSVSDDYGDRFLVELIQNAHDAHEAGRADGEIVLAFAPDECDHGCLYVANRGNGFTKPNLEAITNIAQSSKPVNEGIGNKGLGFRSVLQICSWPEIYSVRGAGGSGTFDGYCFRFAREPDIRRFLPPGQDVGLADEIVQRMPFWHLPVYAQDRPGLVGRFARERFATVVRMPLDSPEARCSVEAQLGVLCSHPRPLHLFLDRVHRIAIEGGDGRSLELLRRIESRWDLPCGTRVERVRVGDEIYCIGTQEVPEGDFLVELEKSLALKQVPESWRKWRGAARVSVAVRIGARVEKGLLYCFLPLGDEGRAPFAGFVNANFYTKMDRSRVSDEIHLNRYFMSVAARVSARVIEFAITQNGEESPGVVIDLLCWSGRYSDEIRRALESGGSDFRSRKLLPVIAGGGAWNWAKAIETLVWEQPAEACISPQKVSTVCGARLLLDSLSDDRRKAVETFLGGYDCSFKPSPEVIATWVEQIASEMHAGKAPPERWAELYDEAALHLRKTPEALFGKRFLLGVNGELIASQPADSATGRRRSADVYFPPVLSVDADSDDAETRKSLPLEAFPKSLRDGFALLSRDVPWMKDDGGYRPARAFLLEGKLVREYDTRDVLRTLAGVTRSRTGDMTRMQALEWAFRLWSSGRGSSGKETRDSNFFVPTRGGWTSARDAMFSTGWSAPNAKRLETFLNGAGADLPDLSEARENLLPGYKDWSLADVGSAEEWTRFLSETGVRDCLRPVGGDNEINCEDRPWGLPQKIVNAAAKYVREDTLQSWRPSLEAAAKSTPHGTVLYRVQIALWRVPGQFDLQRLSTEQRVEYARQVARMLPHLGKEHLEGRLSRPGRGAEWAPNSVWKTPLGIFFEEMPWMPVRRAGSPVCEFVPPREARFFKTDEETAPRFIELVASEVARELDDLVSERLRMLAGLVVLNEPGDARKALSAYAEAARQRISDPKDVKRFRELFSALWSEAVLDSDGLVLSGIPVVVGGEVRALDAGAKAVGNDDGSVTAYLFDEESPAKRQLLDELAIPYFDYGRDAMSETEALLDKLAPHRFKRISDEPLSVLVDGFKVEALGDPPYLSEVFGSWIVDFIVCAAEHKGGVFFSSTQKNLARIRRSASSLRFLTGRRVQIGMTSNVRDLPASLRGGVVARLGDCTVLVAQTALDMPDVSLLAGLAEQLAVGLEERRLANGLEAAFLRLEQRLHGVDAQSPSEDDIAEALGTTVEGLAQTRRYARADLSSQVRFALVLACALERPLEREKLSQLMRVEDPAETDVQEVLGCLGEALALSSHEILERLSTVTNLHDLKDTFGLSLTQLNEAVRSMPGVFKPIRCEAANRRQFAAFLSQHAEALEERLRAAFAQAFEQREGMSDYVSLRDSVQAIEPDEDWFEKYEDLPTGVMQGCVEKWFEDHEVECPVETYALPLKHVRRENAARIRDFVGRHSRVLTAWIMSGAPEVTTRLRSTWVEGASSVDECQSSAYKNGWGDFRPLDDKEIAAWLGEEGLWPLGKPVSPLLEDWGVSESQVRDVQQTLAEEREERKRRRLLIQFDGTDLSALEADFGSLVDVVSQGLRGVTALNDTASANVKLSDIDKPVGSGGSSGAGTSARRSRPTESSLSDEQKVAVGLIGELAAREWIKTHHRIRHQLELSDECWVSGYRDRVLGTNKGDDILGFDFKVQLKSTTYYYEVKASTGDAHVFEMGPTEIGAALRYRADQDNKYRILYISNVLDPKRLAVTLLPNPFSREGEKKLRAIGRGSVTYEFAVWN